MSGEDVHPSDRKKRVPTLQRAAEKYRQVSRGRRYIPLAELCVTGAIVSFFLIVIGTVILILYYFLESQDGFHSVAEYLKIRTDILGFVFIGLGVAIPICSWLAYVIVRALTIVEMANRYQECQVLYAQEEVRQSFREKYAENAEDGIRTLSLKFLDHKEDFP